MPTRELERPAELIGAGLLSTMQALGHLVGAVVIIDTDLDSFRPLGVIPDLVALACGFIGGDEDLTTWCAPQRQRHARILFDGSARPRDYDY